MTDLTREDIQKLTELSVDMKYIKEKLDGFSKAMGKISKDLQQHEKQFIEFSNELKKLSEKVERLQKETDSEISNIVEKSTRFGRFMKANWYKLWIVGSSVTIVLLGWLADHLYHLPAPH